jgi:hypothetical protein
LATNLTSSSRIANIGPDDALIPPHRANLRGWNFRERPVEDFRRDSDLFAEGVHNPEAQRRIQAAFKRGFQTRDAEMNLARLLGELGDR